MLMQAGYQPESWSYNGVILIGWNERVEGIAQFQTTNSLGPVAYDGCCRNERKEEDEKTPKDGNMLHLMTNLFLTALLMFLWHKN